MRREHRKVCYFYIIGLVSLSLCFASSFSFHSKACTHMHTLKSSTMRLEIVSISTREHVFAHIFGSNMSLLYGMLCILQNFEHFSKTEPWTDNLFCFSYNPVYPIHHPNICMFITVLSFINRTVENWMRG